MFIYGISVDNGYKYKRIIENTITKIRTNNIYKIEILSNWWKITNLNTLEIFNILITIANTSIHEKFYLSDSNTLIFQNSINSTNLDFTNFNNTIFSDFSNNILTITDRNSFIYKIETTKNATINFNNSSNNSSNISINTLNFTRNNSGIVLGTQNITIDNNEDVILNPGLNNFLDSTEDFILIKGTNTWKIFNNDIYFSIATPQDILKIRKKNGKYFFIHNDIDIAIKNGVLNTLPKDSIALYYKNNSYNISNFKHNNIQKNSLIINSNDNILNYKRNNNLVNLNSNTLIMPPSFFTTDSTVNNLINNISIDNNNIILNSISFYDIFDKILKGVFNSVNLSNTNNKITFKDVSLSSNAKIWNYFSKLINNSFYISNSTNNFLALSNISYKILSTANNTSNLPDSLPGNLPILEKNNQVYLQYGNSTEDIILISEISIDKTTFNGTYTIQYLSSDQIISGNNGLSISLKKGWQIIYQNTSQTIIKNKEYPLGVNFANFRGFYSINSGSITQNSQSYSLLNDKIYCFGNSKTFDSMNIELSPDYFYAINNSNIIIFFNNSQLVISNYFDHSNDYLNTKFSNNILTSPTQSWTIPTSQNYSFNIKDISYLLPSNISLTPKTTVNLIYKDSDSTTLIDGDKKVQIKNISLPVSIDFLNNNISYNGNLVVNAMENFLILMDKPGVVENITINNNILNILKFYKNELDVNNVTIRNNIFPQGITINNYSNNASQVNSNNITLGSYVLNQDSVTFFGTNEFPLSSSNIPLIKKTINQDSLLTILNSNHSVLFQGMEDSSNSTSYKNINLKITSGGFYDTLGLIGSTIYKFLTNMVSNFTNKILYFHSSDSDKQHLEIYYGENKLTLSYFFDNSGNRTSLYDSVEIYDNYIKINGEIFLGKNSKNQSITMDEMFNGSFFIPAGKTFGNLQVSQNTAVFNNIICLDGLNTLLVISDLSSLNTLTNTAGVFHINNTEIQNNVINFWISEITSNLVLNYTGKQFIAFEENNNLRILSSNDNLLLYDFFNSDGSIASFYGSQIILNNNGSIEINGSVFLSCDGSGNILDSNLFNKAIFIPDGSTTNNQIHPSGVSLFIINNIIAVDINQKLLVSFEDSPLNPTSLRYDKDQEIYLLNNIPLEAFQNNRYFENSCIYLEKTQFLPLVWFRKDSNLHFTSSIGTTVFYEFFIGTGKNPSYGGDNELIIINGDKIYVAGNSNSYLARDENLQILNFESSFPSSSFVLDSSLLFSQINPSGSNIFIVNNVLCLAEDTILCLDAYAGNQWSLIITGDQFFLQSLQLHPGINRILGIGTESLWASNQTTKFWISSKVNLNLTLKSQNDSLLFSNFFLSELNNEINKDIYGGPIEIYADGFLKVKDKNYTIYGNDGLPVGDDSFGTCYFLTPSFSNSAISVFHENFLFRNNFCCLDSGIFLQYDLNLDKGLVLKKENNEYSFGGVILTSGINFYISDIDNYFKNYTTENLIWKYGTNNSAILLTKSGEIKFYDMFSSGDLSSSYQGGISLYDNFISINGVNYYCKKEDFSIISFSSMGSNCFFIPNGSTSFASFTPMNFSCLVKNGIVSLDSTKMLMIDGTLNSKFNLNYISGQFKVNNITLGSTVNYIIGTSGRYFTNDSTKLLVWQKNLNNCNIFTDTGTLILYNFFINSTESNPIYGSNIILKDNSCVISGQTYNSKDISNNLTNIFSNSFFIPSGYMGFNSIAPSGLNVLISNNIMDFDSSRLYLDNSGLLPQITITKNGSSILVNQFTLNLNVLNRFIYPQSTSTYFTNNNSQSFLCYQDRTNLKMQSSNGISLQDSLVFYKFFNNDGTQNSAYTNTKLNSDSSLEINGNIYKSYDKSGTIISDGFFGNSVFVPSESTDYLINSNFNILIRDNILCLNSTDRTILYLEEIPTTKTNLLKDNSNNFTFAGLSLQNGIVNNYFEKISSYCSFTKSSPTLWYISKTDSDSLIFLNSLGTLTFYNFISRKTEFINNTYSTITVNDTLNINGKSYGIHTFDGDPNISNIFNNSYFLLANSTNSNLVSSTFPILVNNNIIVINSTIQLNIDGTPYTKLNLTNTNNAYQVNGKTLNSGINNLLGQNGKYANNALSEIIFWNTNGNHMEISLNSNKLTILDYFAGKNYNSISLNLDNSITFFTFWNSLNNTFHARDKNNNILNYSNLFNGGYIIPSGSQSHSTILPIGCNVFFNNNLVNLNNNGCFLAIDGNTNKKLVINATGSTFSLSDTVLDSKLNNYIASNGLYFSDLTGKYLTWNARNKNLELRYKNGFLTIYDFFNTDGTKNTTNYSSIISLSTSSITVNNTSYTLKDSSNTTLYMENFLNNSYFIPSGSTAHSYISGNFPIFGTNSVARLSSSQFLYFSGTWGTNSSTQNSTLNLQYANSLFSANGIFLNSTLTYFVILDSDTYFTNNSSTFLLRVKNAKTMQLVSSTGNLSLYDFFNSSGQVLSPYTSMITLENGSMTLGGTSYEAKNKNFTSNSSMFSQSYFIPNASTAFANFSCLGFHCFMVNNIISLNSQTLLNIDGTLNLPVTLLKDATGFTLNNIALSTGLNSIAGTNGSYFNNISSNLLFYLQKTNDLAISTGLNSFEKQLIFKDFFLNNIQSSLYTGSIIISDLNNFSLNSQSYTYSSPISSPFSYFIPQGDTNFSIKPTNFDILMKDRNLILNSSTTLTIDGDLENISITKNTNYDFLNLSILNDHFYYIGTNGSYFINQSGQKALYKIIGNNLQVTFADSTNLIFNQFFVNGVKNTNYGSGLITLNGDKSAIIDTVTYQNLNGNFYPVINDFFSNKTGQILTFSQNGNDLQISFSANDTMILKDFFVNSVKNTNYSNDKVKILNKTTISINSIDYTASNSIFYPPLSTYYNNVSGKTFYSVTNGLNLELHGYNFIIYLYDFFITGGSKNPNYGTGLLQIGSNSITVNGSTFSSYDGSGLIYYPFLSSYFTNSSGRSLKLSNTNNNLVISRFSGDSTPFILSNFFLSDGSKNSVYPAQFTLNDSFLTISGVVFNSFNFYTITGNYITMQNSQIFTETKSSNNLVIKTLNNSFNFQNFFQGNNINSIYGSAIQNIINSDNSFTINGVNMVSQDLTIHYDSTNNVNNTSSDIYSFNTLGNDFYIYNRNSSFLLKDYFSNGSQNSIYGNVIPKLKSSSLILSSIEFSSFDGIFYNNNHSIFTNNSSSFFVISKDSNYPNDIIVSSLFFTLRFKDFYNNGVFNTNYGTGKITLNANGTILLNSKTYSPINNTFYPILNTYIDNQTSSQIFTQNSGNNLIINWKNGTITLNDFFLNGSKSTTYGISKIILKDDGTLTVDGTIYGASTNYYAINSPFITMNSSTLFYTKTSGNNLQIYKDQLYLTCNNFFSSGVQSSLYGSSPLEIFSDNSIKINGITYNPFDKNIYYNEYSYIDNQTGSIFALKNSGNNLTFQNSNFSINLNNFLSSGVKNSLYGVAKTIVNSNGSVVIDGITLLSSTYNFYNSTADFTTNGIFVTNTQGNNLQVQGIISGTGFSFNFNNFYINSIKNSNYGTKIMTILNNNQINYDGKIYNSFNSNFYPITHSIISNNTNFTLNLIQNGKNLSLSYINGTTKNFTFIDLYPNGVTNESKNVNYNFDGQSNSDLIIFNSDETITINSKNYSACQNNFYPIFNSWITNSTNQCLNLVKNSLDLQILGFNINGTPTDYTLKNFFMANGSVNSNYSGIYKNAISLNGTKLQISYLTQKFNALGTTFYPIFNSYFTNNTVDTLNIIENNLDLSISSNSGTLTLCNFFTNGVKSTAYNNTTVNDTTITLGSITYNSINGKFFTPYSFLTVSDSTTLPTKISGNDLIINNASNFLNSSGSDILNSNSSDMIFYNFFTNGNPNYNLQFNSNGTLNVSNTVYTAIDISSNLINLNSDKSNCFFIPANDSSSSIVLANFPIFMKNRIFSFNSKCIVINSTSKVQLIQNSNSLTIKNNFFTNGVKIANITNHSKILINDNTINLDGTILSLDNTTFYDINSFELGTNTVAILRQKIGNDSLITNLSNNQSILFKSMEISSSYYSTLGLTINSSGFSDSLGTLSSSTYFAITDFFTNNTGLILRLEQNGTSGILKCQNRNGSITFIDFFNNSVLNSSFYSSIILNSSSSFSLTVNGNSYSAMQNSSNTINAISLNSFFNNNSIFVPQNSTSTSLKPLGIDMFFVNKFFYINSNFSLDIDGDFSSSTAINLLYTNSNTISVNTINMVSGYPNYLLSTNGSFFTTALTSSFLFYFSSGANSDLVLLSPSNKFLYFNNFYISGVKNSFYSNPINLSFSGIQIGSNTIKHIDNFNTLSDIESFSGFILPPNSNNSFLTNASNFFISWLCNETHSVNGHSNVSFLNINNTYNIQFADNILSNKWNSKTDSTISILNSSISFGNDLVTFFPLTKNLIFYLSNGNWAYIIIN